MVFIHFTKQTTLLFQIVKKLEVYVSPFGKLFYLNKELSVSVPKERKDKPTTVNFLSLRYNVKEL